MIAIYERNQTSIEDDTNIAFTEDVAARYVLRLARAGRDNRRKHMRRRR
jgi:hypothetical protein